MGTKGTARAKRTYFRAIRGREGTELWKRHRGAFFLHYIMGIKMQLDIAEQEYREFKEHNGFHDAMGFKWTSEAALERGRALKKRIADLRKQILEA